MSYGEQVMPLIDKYGDGPYPYRVHERSKQKGSFDIHMAARANLARLYQYFQADVEPSNYMMQKQVKLYEILAS